MFILYVYCIEINFLALIPACSGLFDEYPRVQNHLPECSNYNNAHKYTVSITTTLTNTLSVLQQRSQIHGQYYYYAHKYTVSITTTLTNAWLVLLHCAHKYTVNITALRLQIPSKCRNCQNHQNTS